MNRQRIAKFWGQETGTAAAETAVLLPFLLLLAMGTTDLGRYCHAHIAVASAARNGAAYGARSIVASGDSAAIAAAARQDMSSVYGYSSSNPTVTSSVINEGGGDSSVKVTISFQFQTLIRYPGLPAALTLTRVVHMRVTPIEISGDDDGDN